MQYEYTYAQFSSDVSFDILQKELKSHYNNAYYDDTLDQYVFIEDNVIYTIKYYEHSKFLWMDRYKYLFFIKPLILRTSAFEKPHEKAANTALLPHCSTPVSD